MLKSLLLLFFFLFIVNCPAQVKPAEGDTINYRLAGFTVPKDMKAVKYLFEVSEYSVDANGLPSYSNSISKSAETNKAIIMLPGFNKAYAWRVSFIDKTNKAYATTRHYHFRTGVHPATDSTKYRISVTKNSINDTDLFIITDNLGVIYDLNGKPVWYMPTASPDSEAARQVLCLTPTNDHSFTAINNKKAVEFDYDGKILWESLPMDRVSGYNVAEYHHEFVKLPGGNYMGATYQYNLVNTPPGHKFKKNAFEIGILEKRGDEYHAQIRTDNIAYYTKSKQIQWYWKAVESIEQQYFFKTATFNKDGVIINKHLSSFYYDQPGDMMYISFLNTDEILKVKYSTRETLKRYGFNAGDTTANGEKLVSAPYNVHKGPDGLLYAITHRPVSAPDNKGKLTRTYITAYEEVPGSPGLKHVLSIPLDSSLATTGDYSNGGSVVLLKNGNLLACDGNSGGMYMIDKEKKTCWKASAQHMRNNSWQPMPLYRLNFISRTDLEAIILR